jgi:hypothetical protein
MKAGHLSGKAEEGNLAHLLFIHEPEVPALFVP